MGQPYFACIKFILKYNSCVVASLDIYVRISITMTNIILPSFDKTHVLVYGDVMLDRYFHGDATRISPEAPVPVVHVTEVEVRPGGAANVAQNIAALGGKVTLCGLVGQDPVAKELQNCLDQSHIECKFLALPN